MRTFTNLIGIILIIVGILGLAYQGITYTKREKVADIGPIQVSADQEKTIYFPPVLGGLSLAAGIILVIVARRDKK